MVICSEPTDRQEAVDYMYDKFVKCGYGEEELDSAKATALSLNRDQILGITIDQYRSTIQDSYFCYDVQLLHDTREKAGQ